LYSKISFSKTEAEDWGLEIQTCPVLGREDNGILMD
jgi:hypothetical protein